MLQRDPGQLDARPDVELAEHSRRWERDRVRVADPAARSLSSGSNSSSAGLPSDDVPMARIQDSG
jgi:hypothetical protein